VRSLYVPFESGQLSTSSDVYSHEIPGGQYTNLLYQSRQLGLTEKWPEIKQMYKEANLLLGDIPKVTPSSKVVGDLAQFMVSQNLTPELFIEKADTLALPDSVVGYFRGDLGVPPGGFPEPLRTKVLTGRGEPIVGRPGASMADFDLEESATLLRERGGQRKIRDVDVLSHALYPKVFDEWQQYDQVYGEVGLLETSVFLKPMQDGEEITFAFEKGKEVIVKLVSVPPPDVDGVRQVIMELNGERWFVPITDNTVELGVARREKAAGPGQVGSPMPGVVVDVKVKKGDEVKEGDQIATLSAMKMETAIPATKSGKVTRLLVNAGDNVEGDDLLCVIE